MKYLVSVWPNLARKIKKAEKILLLLDYDGTLTPIQDRPEFAQFPKRTAALLGAISTEPRIKVGVISGRSLSELKRLVKIRGIFYAGNHGFEIELPVIPDKNACITMDRHFVHPAPASRGGVHPKAIKAKPVIKRISGLLKSRLSHIQGVIIENKTFTLSLHYRLVRRDQLATVKRVFSEITLPYIREGSVKISSGKKVFEVRPACDWNKGKAVLWFMDNIVDKKILPIYIGDDRTDEDVFRVLKKGGISICVGKRKLSQAKYFVKDTSEVEEFLERIKADFIHSRPQNRGLQAADR